MAKAKKKTASAKAEANKPERHTIGWADCKMPTSINFRRQNHGDEPVPASDIRFSDIELTKEQVNALLQEPYADRALWKAGGRGKPERPMLEQIEPIKLSERIESSKVRVKVGGEEINLGVCKLKSVTVQPMLGGVGKMSCMVQSTPTIDERVASLVAGMDGSAQIRIEYEHNAEQLEAFDADEAKSGDPKLKEFEDAARAQRDAFNRGTPVGDSATGDTH